MPNVTVSEKISSAADARFSFAASAAVDCNEFTKRVFVPDLEVSRFVLIFHVLRLLADRAIGVEFVSRARRHRAGEGDVILQPAVRAQNHVGANYAIRSDDCAGPDFRPRINDRGRMNLHVAH